jgi:ABC-type dipeptide/oligopeptide/nickel transport system ATPase component
MINKLKNIIYLLIFTSVLFLLKYGLIDHVFLSLSKDSEVWFSSGLLLVILGVFITEKFFTSPVDVIVNVVTVIVILLSIDDKTKFSLWLAVLVYSLGVGIIAIVSFYLNDDEEDANSLSQRIARSCNTIASFLGSSKVLFSIMFIISIFDYFIFSIENNSIITVQQISVIVMIIFWGAMLLIEPIDRKLIQPLIAVFSKKARNNLIGIIVKRYSPNLIIAEQFPSSPSLEVGDLCIIGGKKEPINVENSVVMFIGTEESNSKRYLKFYSINLKVERIDKEIYIYRLSTELEEKTRLTLLSSEIYAKRDKIIGFIDINSDIDVIRIKLFNNVDEEKKLKNGDLVSVGFYESSTKYQIINVEANTQTIDSNSNFGIKIITAQQIGGWDDNEQKFKDTGWVPSVNTPVFIEEELVKIEVNNKNCYKVGYIPKSGYPVFINLEESINHHIAVIGKTGTGKSFMSAKIIENLAENNYKVVVLEIDQKNKQSLSKRINPNIISTEKTVWSSESKHKYISGKQIDYEEWKAQISLNTKDNKNVFLVNWDNDSKTQDDGPLTQTDGAIAIITSVIQYQNSNPSSKICIVMEEAYDFIPENNFGQQDYGQPKVSRISQLVLKCRKHNIGFFIITQRTALVSKTILHQCHTIIALQSFDETTKNFMGSYINQKYLDSMSILPKYRAIVVGKGSSCDKPVIVDFHDSSAK